MKAQRPKLPIFHPSMGIDAFPYIAIEYNGVDYHLRFSIKIPDIVTKAYWYPDNISIGTRFAFIHDQLFLDFDNFLREYASLFRPSERYVDQVLIPQKFIINHKGRRFCKSSLNETLYLRDEIDSRFKYCAFTIPEVCKYKKLVIVILKEGKIFEELDLTNLLENFRNKYFADRDSYEQPFAYGTLISEILRHTELDLNERKRLIEEGFKDYNAFFKKYKGRFLSYPTWESLLFNNPA